MTEKKITILTLSDHPLSPSGVGTQTKYMIEAMLKTGKYRFVCLGGAVKHENYQPVKIEPYFDDWVVFPVDGYGTPDMLRSFLANFKPDIVWFMTDPRFWGWLWEMENEVRSVAPMVYYHVWDNKPYPMFNKIWYNSNDVVASISKVTSDVVRNVSPEVEEVYLPHAVNTDVFKRISEEEIKETKLRTLNEDGDKLIFFWNSRNARRKQSGSVIWWFKEYLDVVGHDKARLIMHTDPKDPHGQDLVAVLNAVGLTSGEVVLSKDKLPPSQLAVMYNIADCTIGISDAEGFGLSTFESLACETPIIVNMTGGLQEQVTDGKNWFGIGIEPSSKAVIGSQEVPYIYEDRISNKDFVDALVKITEMSKEERQKLGAMGRQHLMKNYNLNNFAKQWDELFTRVYENCGSWDTRKNYKSWEFSEVS
jgi:glycosyltransferase involved in cell wall biosynthesis